MQEKKVIWIFNQYASLLETRHLELSKEFETHGYTCIVFASSFHHGNHTYLYEEDYIEIQKSENIYFVYLRTRPAYQNNGVKRVISFFDYNRLVMKYSDQVCAKYGPPGYIIASSLHPLVWEIGYKCSKKYNAKWVAEVKDFWPLQLTDIMKLSRIHPMVVFFGIIEKRAYKRCDAIVASMPYAYKYISDELGFPKEKVHWMANGISTARVDKNLGDRKIVIPEELDIFLSENWCCIYCGSFVKSESVPFIVSAFNYLKNRPDICLALVGSGHSEGEIRKTIKEYGLESQVKLFPRVSYEQIPAILEKVKCCIAAVHDYPLYRYGLSLVKLNDYLYSGKPTIFACSYKNVVEDLGGLSIPFGDPKLLAEKIIEVHGFSSEQLEGLKEREIQEIRKNYDYAIIGKRYLELLENL